MTPKPPETSLVPHSRPSADVLAIFERLIGIPTVSRDSNLGLIEWVRDHLAALGVNSELTYDADRRKANLFATLGEGAQPGLILSGHTDVVPVDGQDWHTDPFVATTVGDRIFGRGTADMKGFIAVALASVPRFLAANHGAPFHLALSYDEESGCIGVRGLIKDLEERGLRAAACIVGEPTSMRPIIGHKGGLAYRCCVRGREAHAALTPLGVNAIEVAARLICHIRDIADRLARDEPRQAGFDVPYSTLQTGVIKGGIASNVVPRDCEFRVDLRHTARTDPKALIAEIEDYAAQLLPAMRSVAPESEIRIDKIGEVPLFDTSEDAPLVRHVRALNGGLPTGYVAFGSEAGLFQRAGIPSVICGPGSIEQGHKPDEFITLDQLAQCERFMHRLAEQGAAGLGLA